MAQALKIVGGRRRSHNSLTSTFAVARVTERPENGPATPCTQTGNEIACHAAGMRRSAVTSSRGVSVLVPPPTPNKCSIARTQYDGETAQVTAVAVRINRVFWLEPAQSHGE